MESEGEIEIVYVCFWCGEQFKVNDDELVSFRIGMLDDGTPRYVPSCNRCNVVLAEDTEAPEYLH